MAVVHLIQNVKLFVCGFRCAMESSRTASPGTASPLPDPPEANGNYGIPMPDEQRSDAELEEVWTRAMITMVGGPLTESIDALKVSQSTAHLFGMLAFLCGSKQ